MKILETHIVPAIDENIRLQEYASTIFRSITTRNGIKKAIKRKEILLDGEIAQTSDWIKEHQKIDLLQSETKAKKIFQLKLAIIYEDEYLAVINKPAGYPTSGNYFKTIENALPFNLKVSTEFDTLPYPVPVHRLDNPTSGLLLIAKTRTMQTALHLAFEDRKIQKKYIALVHGSTSQNFKITDALDGKSSSTQFIKLRHLEIEKLAYSLLEAHPDTGRTHQIRIHLSNNDFPIVSDKEYGMEETSKRVRGLYLASIGLNLQHPKTRAILDLNLDLPKKFRVP